jgi:hypothetical protein
MGSSRYKIHGHYSLDEYCPQCDDRKATIKAVIILLAIVFSIGFVAVLAILS